MQFTCKEAFVEIYNLTASSPSCKKITLVWISVSTFWPDPTAWKENGQCNEPQQDFALFGQASENVGLAGRARVEIYLWKNSFEFAEFRKELSILTVGIGNILLLSEFDFYVMF